MKRATLCQTCFCSTCSWHNFFKPVDGWEARPTKIVQGDGNTIASYEVIRCPFYKPRKQDEGWTEVTKTEFARLIKTNCSQLDKYFNDGILEDVARQRGYVYKTYGDENKFLAWFIREAK